MDFFSGIFTFIAEHWLSAFVFIGIFSVLIILHELGHFWAARRAGVRVLEFGFGLPPKVWGKKTSRKNVDGNDEEMEWTLNAIPFGGFVRMEGEEEKSDSPTSFGNRPLGWRILVVCGGVIMNFLLGWTLLTVGYGVGMNPLSPSAEQKGQYVEQGIWEKKEHLLIVDSLGKNPEISALKPFDILKTLDGNVLKTPQDFDSFYSFLQSQKKQSATLVLDRYNSKTQKFLETSVEIPVQETSPFTLYRPQVKISQIQKSHNAEAVGLQVGDIIVGLEQGQIENSKQLQKTLIEQKKQGKKQVRLAVERDGKTQVFITSLNNDATLSLQTQDTWKKPEKNKILLDEKMLYIPTEKVQYPWTQAPAEAFHESIRWMKLSFNMVTDVFTKIIFDQKIPEGVGGPVAIADTTDKLVAFGDWTKILQFTAILSLSLAVVNIMPFPGLDGGRLIFLLAEAIMLFFSKILLWTGIRKKPLLTQLPEKYEMPLHALGYILLLGLILWITWNDISRIFF